MNKAELIKKTLKFNPLDKEALAEYIQTLPNKEIVDILIEFLIEYREVGKTVVKEDNRFPLTQEEFNKYFRIKEAKGRGRRAKTQQE
jgi:hypothetical protein